MERLEEDLTCAVCYSLFTEPRVLPCSHTFCKTCLDNLLQSSGDYNIWRPLRLPLNCPSCRHVAELPPTGTGGLPCNLSLKAIIEKYQNDGHSHGPSCEEHQQQPLNMYCVQDRQLICGLCLTVGQHQGHPIDDLQAAYVREKQTPKLLAKLSEKKYMQVCEIEKELEMKKEGCKDALLQDRQRVLQFFQQLEASLAKKKMAYLDVLDKACSDVAHAYDPLIYKVKEMQEKQLELVTLGSAVEDEDSSLKFLDKVHVFKERVEEFVQTPLPSVLSMSVSPRAADFLHTHWPAVTIGKLDEAPVPKMSYCTRCHSQPHCVRHASWLYQNCNVPLMTCVLFFFLTILWSCPGSVELVGVLELSSISQVIHSVISQLCTSIWNSADQLVTNGSQAFQSLLHFITE